MSDSLRLLLAADTVIEHYIGATPETPMLRFEDIDALDNAVAAFRTALASPADPPRSYRVSDAALYAANAILDRPYADPDDDAALVARVVMRVAADQLADPPRDTGGELDAAWREAEAALPDGWLFHGVELADHSMDDPRGGWGPDWQAAMSWPGHCEYDDSDHDEAFRVAFAPIPAAALRALAARLAAD